MAISARDIFLSVRVSDRATRPLRQISAELRRMGGTSSGAVAQRRRLESQQIAAVKRQQRLIDNITSATSGQKRQALNNQIRRQYEAEQRTLSRVEASQAAITRNAIAQQRAGERITRIQGRPAIDAANRRRLQVQQKSAVANLRELERRQSILNRTQKTAAGNLRNMANVQATAQTRVAAVEKQITSNLAAQEAMRAKLSAQMEREVSIEEMRAQAFGRPPPKSAVEGRAQHFRMRAMFQEEAVLQQRRVQAAKQLARFPELEAAATTKVNAAKSAVLKNTEAQAAAERKIADLQTKIAAAPTMARSRAALAKDLQAAQTTQQQLIADSTRLSRNLDTERAAQTRVIAGRQSLIAADAALVQRTAAWRTELQDTQSQLSRTSAEIARLNAVEQGYLKQENLQKWSQRARMVEHLGHVLTITGLAATVAFAAAAKTAADFQSQAVLAATQARPAGARPGATAQIAQRLNQVILNQMQRFPATADEMAKSLYSIFSGTNVQNIGKASQLLRIFNQEAVAGGTDLDTMTQAGITLFNNFPGQFRNMERAGDRFFAMVRFGRGTAAQFADALSPILPIAKGAGQTFDDVAGTLAFLSRQSKDVTANAQGYARLLLLIARPEVRAGFKRLGIEVVNAQGRIRPLLDIITDLQKRGELPTGAKALTFFKDISQAATGRGTAGTIQAQRAWQRLVEGVDQYRQVSRLVVRDNDEFRASFAALSKAPGVRWRIFTNQLKALVIIIGEQAIPAFVKMGSAITSAVHWFRELSPHTQRMIGYFGAFIAVATLVGGVVITVGGALASMYLTIRLLMGSRGLAGLAGEAGLVQARLLLMMGVVGGLLYVFIRWPNTLHTATRALGGVTNAIELLTAALIAMKLRGALGAGGLLGGLGLGAGLLPTAALAGYLYMIQKVIGEQRKLKDEHQSFWGQMAHDIRPTPFFKGLASNTVAAFTLGSVHVWTDAGRAGNKAYQQALMGRFDRIANTFRRRMRGILTSPVVTTANIRLDPRLSINNRQLINRARAMVAGATSTRAFANAISQAAVGMVRAIGFDVPAAGDKAVRHIKRLVQVAQQFGVTKITPNFQQLFRNLIRARRLMNQAFAAVKLDPTQANQQRALQAANNYQKALTAIQNSGSKNQIAAAKRVADAQATQQKAQLTKQKENIKTATDNVTQMYQDLLQQNQQFLGTLFQGPFLQSPAQQAMREWGVQMRSGDLLKDLKSQVFQFQRFEGALNRLRRRGAPSQLIQQLQQLGPEALPQIELLTKMAPRQWRQYVRVFQQGQNLVKQQTMRDLKSQLGLYRRFGRNVGEQIVLGLRDQNAPMKGEIRKLVLQMFPELRVRGAGQRRGPNQPRTEKHTHYHEHDHTKVEVKPGGSMSSELQRDRFRKKHRPRSPRIRR